jgi:Tol biopolymer transport system component
LVAYPIEENGTPQTASGVVLMNLSPTPHCGIASFDISPDSHYLVVQSRCGSDILTDLTTLLLDSLPLPEELSLRYLSWSPNGEWVIMQGTDWDEIWLIPIHEDEPRHLDMIKDGYSAVFTPDGQKIIYATNKGLGFGSTLGILDLVSGDLTVQQTEPYAIFAYPTWSPDGQYLVYILMPDSNVPFTTGELWLADAQGQPIRRLAEGVDTGHGYPPVWIEDGAKVVYVHRENPMGSEADHEAEALHSNLYEVAIAGGDPVPLTQFSETLVKDPAWLPGANLLAFTAGEQVWVVQSGSSPSMLALPAAANGYPLWIALPQ